MTMGLLRKEESRMSSNIETYLERTNRNHFWLGGEVAQKNVKKLKIAVAGLGGMGSHISELLARMGVGEIRISDPDTIDVSNINRQVIANFETVGMEKREALEMELRRIAPDCIIRSYPGVNSENVDEFIEGCDAIVDEIDVFPINAHLLLHDAANQKKLPLYSSYVVGLGVHFYKFQGNQYTFRDFLGDTLQRSEAPTAEDLVRTFGSPLPQYLSDDLGKRFSDLISTGKVPIFGPATLLGHSLVVSRLIYDLLRISMPHGAETPVMPQFLKLDALDLSLSEETHYTSQAVGSNSNGKKCPAA
jgi:molybdopterin/thiamine biosynthesis adenylyltransferase